MTASSAQIIEHAATMNVWIQILALQIAGIVVRLYALPVYSPFGCITARTKSF